MDLLSEKILTKELEKLGMLLFITLKTALNSLRLICSCKFSLFQDPEKEDDDPEAQVTLAPHPVEEASEQIVIKGNLKLGIGIGRHKYLLLMNLLVSSVL